MIVVLPSAAGSPVVRLTVDLNVNLSRPEDRKIEKSTSYWILWLHIDASLAEVLPVLVWVSGAKGG